MDPYTLAYLAGHSDVGMTRRYVHPQADTIRAAMERAQAASRGSASFGHSGLKADTSGLASNSHVVDSSCGDQERSCALQYKVLLVSGGGGS
jgi:hypothetical protein